MGEILGYWARLCPSLRIVVKFPERDSTTYFIERESSCCITELNIQTVCLVVCRARFKLKWPDLCLVLRELSLFLTRMP